jgi:hypothetical protein
MNGNICNLVQSVAGMSNRMRLISTAESRQGLNGTFEMHDSEVTMRIPSMRLPLTYSLLALLSKRGFTQGASQSIVGKCTGKI